MTVRKQERLVNLAIALLHTRGYASRDELRQAVSGYDGLNDEAFERMFERDKDALRDLGLPVETGTIDKYFSDDVGYRIPKSKVTLPPIDLTPEEATVVALAARAWQGAALGDETTAAVAKLRAAGHEPDTTRVAALAPAMSAEQLDGGQTETRSISKAIRDRRQITFCYHGKQRTLEPWVVAMRRGAWYVLGHDVESGQERLFRLSRVEGEIKAVGRVDAYTIPEGVTAQRIQERLDATPAQKARLAFTLSAPPSLRARGVSVSDPAPIEGYLLMDVDYSDASTLVAEVCAAAPEALIMDPPELRQMAVEHLTRMAGEDHRG